MKNATNVLSRASRNGSPFLRAKLPLLLIAILLFVISSILLLTRLDDHGGQQLRSNDATLIEVTPKITVSDVAASEKIKVLDFRRKHIGPPSDASATLFYNVFIPDDQEEAQHAIGVISEQLGQVAASLKKLEKDKQGAALFYNLIGNDHAFPEESMKSLCSKLHPELSCTQIGRYETASEAVTLQDIHDFCQNEDVANTRVTYIHSKGSYHQTLVNTCWRRAVTDAVVHPDCLSPPDDRCNVCGAQFYTRFSTMFPGNMWTAKCSYIKRLLPPLEGGEYDKRKKESVIKFMKYRLWGQLSSALWDDRVDYFGLGRYSSEHWIGTHPSIQPCDMHRPSTNIETMISGSITPEDFEWAMGPRRRQREKHGANGDGLDEIPGRMKKLEKDEDAQFREYVFLPGNLLKWFTLYGSDGIPAADAWQWKFFPAGNRWKKLVGEYNENAVDEMAAISSLEHSAYSASNYGNETFQIDGEDEKILTNSSQPLVVFYHISIPKDKKMTALRALKTQLDVLTQGQYDIISRSYHSERPVILFYNIAGNSSDIGFFSKICKAKSNLTCRNLGDVTSTKASGETLHHLHNFCVAKPSFTVTYLSNQLPGTYGVNKTDLYSMQKIRAYTTAVTSKMCLKSRETCNVCGTEFYPLPFNHFTGNMFTATCDYVKDLLPPEKFERAMNDAADATLISQLRNAITTELFQFTPQNLGLGQYSVEHWVGSHPDLEPCDVGPVRHSWFPSFTRGTYLPLDYTSSRSYDFMWAQAPRRSSAPSGLLSRWIERRAMAKDDIAFREYYYLAGNLFRWFKLYNKSPPWSSWAWRWFPQGNAWLQGTKKYGPDVVTKISQPFWDEKVPF